MAKYKLMNQTTPEIQKEEVIRADLRNIMMNLLSQRDSTKKEIFVSEEEKGNVNFTKTQLLNRSMEFHAEKEEIVKGDVKQAIQKLFSEERCTKKGILIQEDEKGDINMTIYCLLHENAGDKTEREDILGGDVRRTIHNLLSSASNDKISERTKIDASERGNVQFFTTCIETGALDYLKQLQTGSSETLTARKQGEEEIIGGDVEGTKFLLKKRQSSFERTVSETDIIPGDVRNTVKVFMTEPQSSSYKTVKEEIIKDDLKSTLNSLNQAMNQKTVSKTEEIMKDDRLPILKTLKESGNRQKEPKQSVGISSDIGQAIECLEKVTNTRTEILKKELILDDLKTSLRSLKEEQCGFKEVDKQGTVKDALPGMLQFSERQNIGIHPGTVQRDKKSLLQPVPGPFEPAIRQQAGPGTLDETTKKSCHRSLIEERTEANLPKAPKGTVKIVIDREQNNDALEKSLRKMSNSEHRAMKNVLDMGERMGVWTESKEYLCSGNHMNKHLTATMSMKDSLKTKESENVRESKDDAISSTQSVNKTFRKQQTETCELGNDHRKSQFKDSYGKNQENIQNIGMTKDFQKEAWRSQEKQYSNKDLKKNDMSLQPLPVGKDVHSVPGVTVSGKNHKRIQATDEKQKVDVCLESQDFLMKTNTSKELKMAMERSFNPSNLHPECSVKGNEDSLPPPSPPPPPLSNESSEIDFPLPPPPPLMLLLPEKNESPPSSPTEKTRTEFESLPTLPLPPPPADEKSERECLSTSLPHAPPPAPSQLAHLSSSVPEHHSQIFLQQYCRKEDLDSHQLHSQAKILTGKSPPPTLPKPKLPKRIKDKMSQYSSSGELERSLSDVKVKATLSKDQKRSMVTIGNEHTETKQEVFTRSLGRNQLPIDSVSQTVPKIPAPKEKQTAPLVKSHSFPSGSEQQSPKPYMRKFKTPLMIAEEKYRQQREELAKQRQESSCHIIKTETQHQSLSEKEKEMELQKATQAISTPRKESDLARIQSNLDHKSNAVIAGEHSERQPSTASTLTVATERLQHVLADSEDKLTLRQEGIQNSSETLQSKSACEINQSHKECKTQQTFEQHVEKSPFPQTKPTSPSFKVKTIRLPTLDHTLTETDLSSERHTKQSEVDIQTSTKQMNREIKKTPVSTQCNNKQSVPENYFQLPKTEKRVTIQMAKEYAEKNHKSKLQTVSKKHGEFGEFDRGNVLGREGKNQDSSMSSSKESRLIAERKPEHLQDQNVPRLVQQKIIDEHLDSQIQNFQQTQTQTSRSTIEHKELSQPYNVMQEKKCLRDQGKQQRQVSSNTEDSEQEIRQDKSSFSSGKESQQDDGKCAIHILEFLRKREELQQILSRVKQFEAESSKSGLKTFQTLLNIVPVWLISEEKREYGVRVAMENNLEKVKEEITHIKTQAEDMLVHCEHVIRTAMMASQTGKQRDKPTNLNEMPLKLSNGNLSSNKCTEQKESKIVEEKLTHHQVATHPEAATQNPAKTYQEAKGEDSKVAPPSLKTRPPSPTFITIESTARRAETSAKRELSQSPKHNSCIEPPPRRPMEHTSKLPRTSTSLSPPRSRSEQLVRLKDTTARLAKGTIPCSTGTPVPIVEKRSEVIMSPATLRRQIKIESRGGDSPPTITIPVSVNHVVSGSFRESVDTQEAVKKTEKKETYVHKDKINSVNRAMPETESYDAVEIIRKVEGPHLSEHTERFEATNQTVQMAERFLNGHENEINRWFREFENDPVFRAKPERRAYANGEINHNMKQESHTFCKEEFGLASSSETANFTGFSYRHPREHQANPPAMQPRVHSEARSLNEHFLSVDAFDSQIVGSKVATSSSRSSEAGRSGFDFKHAPPTYEDVIAGHILDITDAPTNLRRNFQETWQESERVFKRVGYETSDKHATETSRAFQEESAFLSGK